ncbi:MAG: acyl-CoA thioesterase, partial [Oceanospirillaceae bacterium]|nr:acyl-CoA thioesterase [Oceanospirillaceae bacterium]
MPLIKINPQFDELFRCSLQVRVADLNYGNHLGNDQILSYFHEGRVLWLNQHSLSEKDVGGCGLIMAATSIEYLAQAYLHQHLELTLGVRAVGKARFTIVYKLTEQQTEQTIA